MINSRKLTLSKISKNQTNFSQNTSNAFVPEGVSLDNLLNVSFVKNVLQLLVSNKEKKRQVSSMIHSTRSTVSPVENIVFALFCFA